MTTTAGNPTDQFRSLKQSIMTALRFHNGFRSVQEVTRRAFLEGLITNEVQQALLGACEPLNSGTAPDPYTQTQMVSKVAGLINDEIIARRKADVG